MRLRSILSEYKRRCYTNIKYLILHTPKMNFASVDYDDYWKTKKDIENLGKANPFQAKRGQFISANIEDGSTILDIGTGDGSVLFEIMKRKNIKSYGTDFSDYILDFLNKNGIESIKYDFNDEKATSILPESDYILMLEIIEHMQDSEIFVKKMLAKSQKGIFFSVPNTGFFPWRIRFLFGRFPAQWIAHPGEHLRYWTYNDMQWWLKELGFNNVIIYGYEGYPY